MLVTIKNTYYHFINYIKIDKKIHNLKMYMQNLAMLATKIPNKHDKLHLMRCIYWKRETLLINLTAIITKEYVIN